jgi:hypothetical protein
MFTPTIDLQVLNRSTVLRFSDTTGVDTGDGTKWDGIAGLDSTDVTAATLTITDPNDEDTVIDVAADIAAADPILAGDEIVFDDQTSEWVDGYYSVQYDVWMVATNITVFADYSGTVAGAVLVTSALHLVQTGMKVTIAATTNYNGFYDATYINANQYYIIATWVADDATGTSTPCYSNTFVPFVFSNVEIALEKMYAIFAEMDESVEADEYLKQIETCNGLLNTLKSAITTVSTASVNNIYGRITRILDYNNMDLIYS